MGEVAVAVLAGAWVVEALLLGYVMRRRGFDAYAWTLIGISLGPIAVGVALFVEFHPPSREPRLWREGRRGTGAIDVLVGIDGSPESSPAVDRVAALFGARCGRAAHPELGTAAVVLRGEPVAALRDYVNRLGYEVLAVGTRGEAQTFAALGSVAAALARGATTPVLLVDDNPVRTNRSVPSREPARASGGW